MGHVVFRRIGGRIVPVGMSNETKERAKGAATVAAGGAVSLATGRKAASMVHESALHENMSRASTELYNAYKDIGNRNASLKHGYEAITSELKSQKLLKRSFAVKHIGTVGAAALIGAGTNRILEQTKLKDSPNAKAAVTAGSMAAATFGLKSRYLRNLGNRRRDAVKGAFRAAVKIIKRVR